MRWSTMTPTPQRSSTRYHGLSSDRTDGVPMWANATQRRANMPVNTPFTRRQFTAGAVAAGAVLAAPSLVRAQADELRVLTWEGYAEPEWLDPFEEATGAAVSVSYVG